MRSIQTVFFAHNRRTASIVASIYWFTFWCMAGYSRALHVSLWTRAHMLGTIGLARNQRCTDHRSEWMCVSPVAIHAPLHTYLLMYFHKAECRMRYMVHNIQTDSYSTEYRLDDKSFVFTVIGHINIERMGHWDTHTVYMLYVISSQQSQSKHRDLYTRRQMNWTRKKHETTTTTAHSCGRTRHIRFSIPNTLFNRRPMDERTHTNNGCLCLCSALQWRFRGK